MIKYCAVPFNWIRWGPNIYSAFSGLSTTFTHIPYIYSAFSGLPDN